jgi:hypothetical protein
MYVALLFSKYILMGCKCLFKVTRFPWMKEKGRRTCTLCHFPFDFTERQNEGNIIWNIFVRRQKSVSYLFRPIRATEWSRACCYVIEICGKVSLPHSHSQVPYHVHKKEHYGFVTDRSNQVICRRLSHRKAVTNDIKFILSTVKFI